MPINSQEYRQLDRKDSCVISPQCIIALAVAEGRKNTKRRDCYLTFAGRFFSDHLRFERCGRKPVVESQPIANVAPPAAKAMLRPCGDFYYGGCASTDPNPCKAECSMVTFYVRRMGALHNGNYPTHCMFDGQLG
ncbi:hypothetical protein CEXT_71181 [Caerostris extrusa]|uniref:BPTI/Kunitz inhibitor domain-containing protein n=1 Tax=Caerostris extrusa TaxID=172846 RepID=A0AAV4Y7P2_CAEEX|nr:hypothetical protein CEXT_71181 [Caerostris extrusa]